MAYFQFSTVVPISAVGGLVPEIMSPIHTPPTRATIVYKNNLVLETGEEYTPTQVSMI